MRVSYLITRKLSLSARPFTEGELVKDCMLSAASILCPAEVPKFESVSLSPRTLVRRGEEMARDLEDQLREKVKSFITFSLSIDESTDNSSTEQMVIFIKGTDDNLQVTEEYLDLVPFKGTTTAEDIFGGLEEVFDNFALRWDRMYSLAVDGAPVMLGHITGLVGRVRRKVLEAGGLEIIAVHCIIHKENLCARAVRLKHVMDVVVKTVNFIRSGGQGLNHRQFQEFLRELDCSHRDVPFYTEVRWLSCGKVLARFFQLREEIVMFLEMKLQPVQQLTDPDWLRDLAFLVDITTHLNELNHKLQGKGKLVIDLLDSIRAFRKKVEVWKVQLGMKNCDHFPTLRSVCPEEDMPAFDFLLYVKVLDDLEDSFQSWFRELEPLDSVFQVFATPFSVDPSTAPAHLQMELIDLQSDRYLKERYRLSQSSSEGLVFFYTDFPKERFPRLHLLAARILCMFGTTYCNEQFFSKMKIVKSPGRSLITDLNLQSSLRVMCTQNLTPNIEKLVRQKRCQVARSGLNVRSSSSS